ncbi:hypothetical protein SYNTR_1503 [Candidatus Syntrophocurvum alkaliphilum]|uniref:Uncharacterized protein n=1 Tax=Candidatus Syntrophocurvum alkaliphilum TaxID=2293317 RepID=A0A6I6DG62_9FIRM|nr:hypothetical protein [Candidatus Syntrophocurvum alkaliphilum]QGU00097.1 hypothetical protein SYNTR_1503 [Candidatus Syntrophocurvum alkaliphilum]
MNMLFMPNLILALLLIIAIFFLVVAVFQWLWNITMPDVFNLNTITFWQAFRLLLIAAILFGGASWSFNM